MRFYFNNVAYKSRYNCIRCGASRLVSRIVRNNSVRGRRDGLKFHPLPSNRYWSPAMGSRPDRSFSVVVVVANIEVSRRPRPRRLCACGVPASVWPGGRTARTVCRTSRTRTVWRPSATGSAATVRRTGRNATRSPATCNRTVSRPNAFACAPEQKNGHGYIIRKIKRARLGSSELRRSSFLFAGRTRLLRVPGASFTPGRLKRF